ncbi:hypothetical protein AX15_004771 [Amanita polypyramis BW_CC]|nr:hypothetical protein AX15_004771 [Amanita polypyramis BW_CC]
MPPSLPSMPLEVLRRIALFAIGDNQPGPPGELYSLLLTCKSMLKLNAKDLHYAVFAAKFEAHSPLRRLGKSLLKQQTILELRRRFAMLKRIRSGYIDESSITEALWLAYTILEDISVGSKGYQQLVWAKFPKFLDNYLRSRLYEGAERCDGWPVMNERNSLAITLSWFCLTEAAVKNEKEGSCVEIMQLLEPFVFAAFRYPIFGANEYFANTSRKIPSTRHSQTAHGLYPPQPLPKSDIIYFGNVPSKARVPLAPLFASMLYFARFERNAPAIPPHLESAPLRAGSEASNLRYEGPTLEDIIEFVQHCHTRFVRIGGYGPLQQLRALCIDMDKSSPHTLGSIMGRWQGSYILPFIDDYQSWLKSSTLPSSFKTTGRVPFFLTLGEHYTCEGEMVIPHDDEINGTLHAWLPQGCRWEKKEDGIEVFDEGKTFSRFYRTYRRENVDDTKVVDIIVTGKTEGRHAAAWGAYSVIGRVRLGDGLVMLRRQSLNGFGTTLMRGYVTTCGNFVGRLKGASSGVAPAGWEGVFILCRTN